MSRYKLGVFNKKESRIINLDSIVKINDLKTLDELTTLFNNENELKAFLFNQGLINKEELKQNITILYRYNGKVKKTPIFYQDMSRYLDLVCLRYELKALSSDVGFLEKLANYYSNGSTSYNKQGLNVAEIRHYLNDVRRNGGQLFYSTMLETAIEDLFKKEIIREISKEDGEVKEDYRGMRDLALLIIKYKKAKEKIDQKIQPKQIDNIWEQPTLFDILRETDSTVEMVEDLGEDVEPDFPYNSEEEKNYQKYLSSLPNEEQPHHRR